MVGQKNFFFLLGGLFLIALLLLFILSNPNKTILMNSNEFEQLISSEEVFVINTHTPYMGEIVGTDLIAEDWQNMESYLSQLPADKSTPIAVYCRSGSMSAVAAQQLKQMGYNAIYDLDGGMNAWQENGKNIIQN